MKHLRKADTAAAEKVLMEGIDRYEDNEDLILLLVDLYFQTDAEKKAVELLDDASSKNPAKHIFPYTKGMIYQKKEQYETAIDAYREAFAIAPEEIKIYSNIGSCYYNIGVEIEKNARKMTNKRAVTREKEKSAEAFETAVTWFEKVLEKDPDNQNIISKLNHLHRVLGISNQMYNMEGVMIESPRN